LPNGMTLKLGGGSKLDQTLAYGGRMAVPSKLMNPNNALLTSWQSQAKSKGLNFTVPTMIPVDLGIGGTILKPQVKIGLKGAASSVVNNLKDQAKDMLEAEKLKAEKRVRDSIDRVKERVNLETDKAKAEAQRRIEEERKAADEKVRAERAKAEAEAKRKIEEEKQKAKDKLKDRLRGGGG